MNLYIKDINGKPSASLTLSVIAFILTSVWFLISFLHIKVGSWEPRQFNETAAIAFLIPCLSLYWGRRFSDNKQLQQLQQVVKNSSVPSSNNTNNTGKSSELNEEM